MVILHSLRFEAIVQLSKQTVQQFSSPRYLIRFQIYFWARTPWPKKKKKNVRYFQTFLGLGSTFLKPCPPLKKKKRRGDRISQPRRPPPLPLSHTHCPAYQPSEAGADLEFTHLQSPPLPPPCLICPPPTPAAAASNLHSASGIIIIFFLSFDFITLHWF